MTKKRKRSPNPPQPPGRPTTLTPEVQEEVVKYVLEGNYFNVACELAGIPSSTGRDWLRRGLGQRSDRDPIEPFAGFASAVKNAQAKAERDAIARIREAAIGRQVTRTKTVTKTYRDHEGNEVTETTNESVNSTNYDWTADAWILERSRPERWGKQRMAELEAWKILIEAGQVPEEIIDAILAGEEDRRSRIQAVVRRSE